MTPTTLFGTPETVAGEELRAGDHVIESYPDALIVERITWIEDIPGRAEVALRIARGDRRAVYPDGTVGREQTDQPLAAFGLRGRYTVIR